MDEKPKRCWFRFRISTVLILTAIVAWGMAIRPRPQFSIWEYQGSTSDLGLDWEIDIRVSKVQPGGRDSGRSIKLQLPKSLSYPALALVAFLAWKAAWALGPRIVRRRDSAASK